MVLDEGHLLETEIVKFRGLSISKRRWKRYLTENRLKIIDFGYNDIEKWIDFLIELEAIMLNLLGYDSMVESLDVQRKIKYNWTGKRYHTSKSTNYNDRIGRITSASDLFDSDEEIVQKYEEGIPKRSV